MVPFDLKKVHLTPNVSYVQFSNAPPGDIGIRIEMYADYINHAMLDHADALAKSSPWAGYAALTVALTYFEGYWAFKTGKDHVGGLGFRNAFFEAFPPKVYVKTDPQLKRTEAEIAEDVARRMYSGARCGLYHVGLAKTGIYCTNEIIDSISIQYPMPGYEHLPTFIAINPMVFIADIRDHFDAYVGKLKDPSERVLRDNFLKLYLELEKI
jgi:hypothetical protein